MTKEKLFELAAQMVAANISAGQFNDGMNFGTIIHDQMQTAYDRLETVWKEVSQDVEVEDDIPIEPEEGSATH
ncbi:hypothetical protein GJU93_16645 [Brucella sp. 10RB9212]|uniref:hypothetical protein n=1 Tax=unclassified Brucella TaxID=2632610 RepID=UPI0009729789|nr:MULTISPECIES: hypothetical protein [unclassified Brucella]APY14211.1 hypothetical protein BKD02_07945 [Brucella sp. 09RB8910]APY14761.1 hypothetical protein BKD02_11235 [Brucella sp. 09RB8910]MRN48188.1 hypothetical protein [Brucella sp. 10RB9212]